MRAATFFILFYLRAGFFVFGGASAIGRNKRRFMFPAQSHPQGQDKLHKNTGKKRHPSYEAISSLHFSASKRCAKKKVRWTGLSRHRVLPAILSHAGASEPYLEGVCEWGQTLNSEWGQTLNSEL